MSTTNRHAFAKALAAVAAGLGTAGLLITLCSRDAAAERELSARDPSGRETPPITQVVHREGDAESPTATPIGMSGPVKVCPAPKFIENGLTWLIKAQHKDGGWGAGSHANQSLKDPHAVAVDPATTAFVASALLRYGHSPIAGEYQDNSRRATEYLCSAVEEYTKPGPKITDLEGTQIQSKLGPLVDTAMTAQYLARVLAVLPKDDKLHARVDFALDKCLSKLKDSQQKDGSWNVGGGWANVLQSSLGCSAFEYAQAAGKPVEKERLDRARNYQLGNVDARQGTVNTEAAAGVALYAYNGSFRGNAARSKAADDVIAEAKKEGKLPADAPVNEENLKAAGVKEDDAKLLASANFNINSQAALLNGGNTFVGGTTVASGGTLVASTATSPASPALPTAGPTAVSAPVSTSAAVPAIESVASVAGEPAAIAGDVSHTGSDTLALTIRTSGPVTRSMPAGGAAATDDEALLAGFGNNGGEEFLSYMLASESMVILGENDWNQWYDRMSGRLAKVQNPDGSWSGHHCITSPVFCTAAVVQTMTADHDAEMLAKLAKEAATLAKADVKK